MTSLAFQSDQYLLKRQVLAFTGKFRIYDQMENLLFFSEQKMFRLREDIRVYADEEKLQEVLVIKARQIIDFSAAYDVVESATGQKAGTLRRKGWRSLLRDEWEILDANEQPIGLVFEDNMGRALLRRFMLGTFLPQHYDVTVGTELVGDLRQRFNLFAYRLEMDFSMDRGRRLDRRLGIAAGILLAAIEGKQRSE